jgi:hypothetical protein
LTKNWLGYILGDFFYTNSSGHPVSDPNRDRRLSFPVADKSLPLRLANGAEALFRFFSPQFTFLPVKLFWVCVRVARWFVFKPKIPIWVNFGGPWRGKC